MFFSSCRLAGTASAKAARFMAQARLLERSHSRPYSFHSLRQEQQKGKAAQEVNPTRPWRVFLCPVTSCDHFSGRDNDLEPRNNSGIDRHCCRPFLRRRVCVGRLAHGFPAGAPEFGQCIAVDGQRSLRHGYRASARCHGCAQERDDHPGTKRCQGNANRIESGRAAYEGRPKNTILAARKARTTVPENDH